MKNLSLLVLGLTLPLCLFSTAAYSNSLAELERIAAQAKTLEEFLGSTIVKEQYFNALKTYQHRDRFRCESFDKILAKVKTLSEKVPGFSKAIWEKTSATDIEVVAYRPIDDKKGSPFLPDKFMFRGTPRRFHALWNDPSLSGCYSDACNEDDTAMPDRWSVALQGSELYYVEKNGIFTDQSVLFLPLKRKDKDYRLIVIGGGPALLKEVDIWNGGRHKSFRQSLAQTLAQRLQKSRWKDNRQELLINKTERVLASTGAKVEGPIPVDEFAVPDVLGANLENALPRKCLTGNLKSLAASLGKKSLSDEMLQKFPVNSQLAPTFNDINAVSKMLADGSLSNKLPEASTLSDSEKELVDSQLMKLFLDTSKDPALRAKAGIALNQFNRPDFSNAFWNRSNPYRPVALNPKEVKAEVASAFAKSLHDPNASVRAAAALGAIDSQRPIPPQALANLENSFKPTTARKIASATPEVLDNLIGAADRAGVFSPDLDKNTSNPQPRLDSIEQLAKAIKTDEPFGFKRMENSVKEDLEKAARNPDSRRRATQVLTENINNPPPGGSLRAQIQLLGDPDVSNAVKDMVADSLKNAQNTCPKERKLKSDAEFFKNSLPAIPDTARWEHWLRWLESPAFASTDHSGASTKASGASEGATSLWQCHEDGSTPSMVERHVGRSQMFFLNTMWDTKTKSWKSVAPGTPNSVCRYFLSDNEGTFKNGYINGGSIVTGAILNRKEDKDVRHIYVPPEFARDPSMPTGWVKLCPKSQSDQDAVAFTRGMENGKKVKFDPRTDIRTLADILRSHESDVTLAELAQESAELTEKLKDPEFALSQSRCGKATGDSSEPRYCTFGPEQRAKAADLGEKLYDTYPGIFRTSATKED